MYLLEERSTGEKLVVNVMSYSGGVAGGYDTVECPSVPTFDLETLEADDNMEGMMLFVKQGCIDDDDDDDWSSCDVTSTDDWECKFDAPSPTTPFSSGADKEVISGESPPVAAPTTSDDDNNDRPPAYVHYHV